MQKNPIRVVDSTSATKRVTVREYDKADKEGKAALETLLTERGYVIRYIDA